MKIEELVQPAADWAGGSWANRADQAASFLHLHGYITAKQRARITEKLERQFKVGLALGLIVPADRVEG